MRKRKILIDADVVAYQCAAACEEAYEWEPGFWTWNVSWDRVVDTTLNSIENIRQQLEADLVTIAVTPVNSNFRLDLLPSYKTHRKTDKKPLVLYHLRDYLVEEHDAIRVDGLEADDVLGILGSRPSEHETIIVSLDKDLKTIPCDYVRTRAVFDDDGLELVGAWEITNISEQQADFNWMGQTLTGDTVDGYKGCPGIGPKKVDNIIHPDANLETNWNAVVEAFEAKGLGPEAALTQARVARILRDGDYDFKRKEVNLWTPTSSV